jgi:hypothetical protein
MTPRSEDTIAADEGRTQGAQTAAPFARPRTLHFTGQRVLAVVVSLFSSLLGFVLLGLEQPVIVLMGPVQGCNRIVSQHPVFHH